MTPANPAPAAAKLLSTIEPAPTTLRGLTRQLGPGLILSAIIVGAGELIVTPKLGAEVGFRLLWFIILGCLVKVFVQIELGRYAVTRGRTTLEALNTLPGPRLIVSWVMWIWLAMYLCLVPQVAGIVGGVATALKLGGAAIPVGWLAVLVGASTAALLVVGRYRLVESFSTVLVGAFTVTTLVAVVALQFTPYAVTGEQLASGLSFHLPANLATAFGAFGLIGVGASELIYYPYWCLEKGYARKIGPDDGTPEWRARAAAWLRVMRVDAWLCFTVYTITTIAFYLLGAAILHAKQLQVEDSKMIETLSFMYLDAFGGWSLWVFAIGAIAVLYSTVFGGTASNARLLADSLAVFRLKTYRDAEHRVRWVKISAVILAVAFTSIFLLVGNPVSLVFLGAVAQGMMLPFLAGAALYFHFTSPHRELRARPFSLAGLIVAAVAMTALGGYQVIAALTR
ncbi:Nramp family divalent metal transporter [Opitutus terrae]|uniref:Mn2+ and Fe2+ transporters of the NRAMP family-like protein n=1 Tax=Opitutus terrae (strain DSM 11246 / JCM 15787 / PB90-1) TaxID=452637 RepID=B1ZVF6_OPITP|nr:Nramp family divalent metal transporter [Opitutus terrae]ACB76823.1 Mn2+ and Fe2+ transporters of the NRAMP family-like protein [Opitutus terrae PB90-1]